MNKYQKLEERVRDLEQEKNELSKSIDRMDRDCFELAETVSKLKHIIEEMVESSFREKFSKDIDYICLKLNVSGQQGYDVKSLPLNIQIEYRETGKVPSLQEYHEQFLRILSVPEDEKQNYPIEISIDLLKKYEQMEEFSYASKILGTK